DNYGKQTTPGTSPTGTEPGTSQSSGTTLNPATPNVSQTAEFFDAKKFIGTSVKDSQGQNLGDIRDIVFCPTTGEVFAAFSASNRGQLHWKSQRQQQLQLRFQPGLEQRSAQITSYKRINPRAARRQAVRPFSLSVELGR